MLQRGGDLWSQAGSQSINQSKYLLPKDVLIYTELKLIQTQRQPHISRLKNKVKTSKGSQNQAKNQTSSYLLMTEL